jgi:lysozyme
VERPVSIFRSALFASALTTLVAISGAQPTLAGAPKVLEGIDVSHHNDPIDWAAVKAAGIRFVFAKATESSDFVDPSYVHNKQQVEALGLPFGAYHFAQPSAAAGDAAAEADHFVDAAALTGADLVPVLDLEVSGGLGQRRLIAWAKAWLAEVHTRLRVKATIYTTPSFWSQHMGNTTWFAKNGYRLWVAHWTDASKPTVPANNWAGRGWTLWQYDNCGSVAGISGCVDRDRYNGTGLAALKIKNNR